MKKNLKNIQDKAHSELSASGSERWLNCPGSVKLSRNLPEPPSSKWAIEGTEAHSLLEKKLLALIENRKLPPSVLKSVPNDMLLAVDLAVTHIKNIWDRETEELVTEEKISLEFIHETMFGTADIQIIEDFGLLQVWDYKHGAGHLVNLKYKTEHGTVTYNTQLIYYLLGVAYKFNFDFEKFRIGVIQPRCKNENGSIRFVDLDKKTVKNFVDLFKRGVDRVYSKNPSLFVGRWCHWCPAKKICPKQERINFDKNTSFFDDL